MNSITEEMCFRQCLCEHALKYGVIKAARRYHANRQFVYRQLEKYNGDIQSVVPRPRKPKHSPNAHAKEELNLIRRMLKRNRAYSLAGVYVRCWVKGYARSFESICRQIRKKEYRKSDIHRKNYTKYDWMVRFPVIKFR